MMHPDIVTRARLPAMSALSIFALAAIAQAAEPDLAYGAYQAGHYRRALRGATDRLAKDGTDTAAMTLTAEIYRLGLGVRADARIAAEWYRLAADKGDAHAMNALSLAYFAGQGVPRDTGKGEEWLRKAAALRQPQACYNLALALLGSNNDENLPQAIDLLRIAAEAEIGDAQHALAALMKQGRGLPADIDGAADMMRRAANNGSLAGIVELAIMTFNGEGTGRDEQAARQLFTRAAVRGNAIAQNRLARLLAAGRGGPVNLVEAASWHLAARVQGLGDAGLDLIYEGLSPEDRARAQALASDRVDDAALTAPTRAGK